LLNSEKDMQVVGEAANAAEALRLANQLEPDVALLDISLPDQSGIQVTQILKARNPKLRILILTIHEDEGLLRAAIQNGASGYILKRAVAELVNAIRSVPGDLYIHPAMTRALLGENPLERASSVDSLTLTARELDVLRLIAQGFTNRQIAEKLTLSVRTVESHRANLMDKLDLHSRVELVRYAANAALCRGRFFSSKVRARGYHKAGDLCTPCLPHSLTATWRKFRSFPYPKC
jgi:DNA-binding NarL/FixJ family response regulator